MRGDWWPWIAFIAFLIFCCLPMLFMGRRHARSRNAKKEEEKNSGNQQQ